MANIPYHLLHNYFYGGNKPRVEKEDADLNDGGEYDKAMKFGNEWKHLQHQNHINPVFWN